MYTTPMSWNQYFFYPLPTRVHRKTSPPIRSRRQFDIVHLIRFNHNQREISQCNLQIPHFLFPFRFPNFRHLRRPILWIQKLGIEALPWSRPAPRSSHPSTHFVKYLPSLRLPIEAFPLQRSEGMTHTDIYPGNVVHVRRYRDSIRMPSDGELLLRPLAP